MESIIHDDIDNETMRDKGSIPYQMGIIPVCLEILF